MSIDARIARLRLELTELRDDVRAARGVAEGGAKTKLRRQANALEAACQALRLA